MLSYEQRSIIWFSPSSAELLKIQTHYSHYSWTSCVESLLEHHAQLNASPIILFDVAGCKEQSATLISTISNLLPHIPILVVAGTEHTTLIEQALEAGAFEYYLGPLDSVLLKIRIESVYKVFTYHARALSKVQAGGVSEPNESQEIELAFMAFYDELTGLANRKLLFSRLEDYMNEEIPDGKHLALLYIDLDGFKEINDTHTHKAGDWLLQQVSIRLRHGVKRQDTVARVGGDEFSIILADPLSKEEIASIAQRIIYQLESPYYYVEGVIRISASVGIALYPLNAINSNELFNRADFAMYIAKQNGKGHLRFYDESCEMDVLHNKVIING